MYFITAMTDIKHYNDKLNEHKKTRYISRCFGYYADKEEAIAAVLSNRYDIHECLYTYVVIEKIGEGIHYCPPDEEIWFKWETAGHWVKIKEKPEEVKQIINFGIG